MKDWIVHAIIALAAVFAPIKALLAVVGVLVMLDLATGVWVAKRNGEPISSAKLRNTVTKALIYQIAIMTGFLVEHYLADDFIAISKIVAGLIGVTELKSIYENFDKISGGELFKAIIEKLGSKNLPKDDEK